MQALFSGPHIADLLAAVILLELAALAWRRPGRLAGALPHAVAGLGLVLGLRSVLAGAAWPWLAGCLLLSGAAFGVDMHRRWMR